MRIFIAIAATIGAGLATGCWRGQWGWEMLNNQERLYIASGVVIVMTISIRASLRPLPQWLSVLLPFVLSLLFSTVIWTIFEPRFHLNFYGNGILCLMRSVPSAIFTAIVAHFILKLPSRLSCALLAAAAGIVAQTIYCPIVESRHMAIFHAGQLLLWPLLATLLPSNKSGTGVSSRAPG